MNRIFDVKLSVPDGADTELMRRAMELVLVGFKAELQTMSLRPPATVLPFKGIGPKTFQKHEPDFAA